MPTPTRDRSPAEATFSIGELAASAAIGVETVRYYERRGLLPAPQRSASGYRRYTTDDVWRLAFIRHAKTLGFRLGDIATLLGAEADRSVGEVRRIAYERLAQIDDDLQLLVRHRDRLRLLLDTCATGPDDACLALTTPAGPASAAPQPLG